MMRQKKFCGYLASGLLLLVTLSFGLFNASGHVISTTQFPHTQVELSLEKEKSVGEVTLSTFYSQLHCESSEKHHSPFIFNSTYLIGFNTFIFVKYQSQSEKTNSINPASHFIQLKRIPQNSDDPFKS